MRPIASRVAPAAILLCLAAQLVMALVVIPPWQGSDEPQHLLTARLMIEHGADFVIESHRGTDTERAIVESMARHRWWEHYGRPAPDPLPPSFAAGPEVVVGSYFGAPPDGSRLYYRGIATIFRTFGIDGLLEQLYTMRALSALLSLLLGLVVWAASRTAFDDRTALVIGSSLALHPQFIVGSITGGPDAVVNLAGAVAWGAGVMLIRFPQAIRYAAVVWVAAVIAVLTRRLGAPLLLVVVGLTCWLLVHTLKTGHRRVWLASGATAVAIMVLAGAVYLLLGDEVDRAARWASFDPAQSIAVIQSRAEELPNFFNTLFQTFWLGAGWMRYLAQPRWYFVAAAFTVAGLAGLFAWRRQEYRGAIVLSAAMVLVQLAAITAYHFGITQSGATGRYLFPVLPAIMCLIWRGWRAWFPESRQSLAALSFVTVMALLNLSAWTLVLLPAFA